MAAEVIKDAVVTVGGVDLSSVVKAVRLPVSFDVKEKTGMGDAAKRRAAGAKDWELGIDWYGDYAASGLYATVQPLVGTSAAVTVKKDSGATAPTNPLWSGNVLVSEFPFIDAEYGEYHEFSTTWPCDGDITTATS